MPREFPGWLHISVAAPRYGTTYHVLWQLVRGGVFTRGRFISEKAGPIYLRIDELDAWKRGGVDAVAALRLKAQPDPDDPIPTHDIGGEAGGA